MCTSETHTFWAIAHTQRALGNPWGSCTGSFDMSSACVSYYAFMKLITVVNACLPGTSEARTEDQVFQASLGYVVRP